MTVDTQWFGQSYPPSILNGGGGAVTTAHAGSPGTFDGPVPAGEAEMGAVVADPSRAWEVDEYVFAADGTSWRWSGLGGNIWAEVVVLPDDGESDEPWPQDFDELVSLGSAGNTDAWAAGESVELGDGSFAYWDGSAWQVGVAPAELLVNDEPVDTADDVDDEPEQR